MNKISRVARKIITGEVFLIIFPEFSFYVLRKKYRLYLQKLASKNSSIIIRMEYGGLGDHLVYSALPEILFQKYGVKTEISLSSEFRSEEIKDFVWGHNPYISFSPKNGIVIHLPRLKRYRNYNNVLVDLFSAQSHSLFSTYYKPVTLPEFASKVVCDLTFGPSGKKLGYEERIFWDAVATYLQKNFRKEELVLLDPAGKYLNKELLHYVQDKIGIKDLLMVHSLYELADVINSARERVFFLSGAKSLAAAYGKPSIVLDRGLLKKDYFHYQTNTYIII